MLASAALTLLGATIFWPFLFGDAVLLYKDIGSDSLISYYPEFVHLSNYIRQTGFPSWSFYVGLGQDVAYTTGYLLWQPVTWLPQDWIAPALVYQHLIKVVITGLLFFKYLQLRRLHPLAALLGALLLSFSAYMCMGSCWYPFADEVLCFAALLLGIEKTLQDGRWLLLVLATALVGMINPFYLYLCALFLVCYVPIRLYRTYGWKLSTILGISSRLAVVAALGAGLGAIVTLPYLEVILNSPRGSGAVSLAGTLKSFPVFRLETVPHYVTAVLRFFANDMQGTADGFRGWQNYLEAPLGYCGLLTLLLLPQVFVLGKKRDRLLSLFFLAAIIVPTIFPWFRYLFWLFQGDYYRTYSLFCVLGLLIVAASVLSRYIHGESLNPWLVATTLLVLVSTLYCPLPALQSGLQPQLRSTAVVYLLLYSLLLVTGQLLGRRTLFASITLVLVAFELIQFDGVTVCRRQFLTKRELTEKTGYNDETVEAVRDITAADAGFFRISKPRPSAPTVWLSLNDSMVFGYYGTSSYSSFNNVNYTDFLAGVGAIRPGSEGQTRWSSGTLDYPLLSTFLSEKYALIDEPALYQTMSQYRFVKRYGQDCLFQNQMFLPLGLTFTRSLDQGAFSSLPVERKQEALLRAVVLPSSEIAKSGLLSLSLDELESEVRNTALRYVIKAHQETALRLTSFAQSHFEGSLRLDQKTMLVLQTAFDPGWRAVVNGKPASVSKVDLGLLGLALDSGEQNIQLSYRNRLLPLGSALSALSLLGLCLICWRWRRLGLDASA